MVCLWVGLSMGWTSSWLCPLSVGLYVGSTNNVFSLIQKLNIWFSFYQIWCCSEKFKLIRGWWFRLTTNIIKYVKICKHQVGSQVLTIIEVMPLYKICGGDCIGSVIDRMTYEHMKINCQKIWVYCIKMTAQNTWSEQKRLQPSKL